MIRKSIFACIFLISATHASAQQKPQPWTFAFPQPPADSLTITRDVQFATSGTDVLRMDVYRPRTVAAGSHPATLVFFAPSRTSPFYTSWAQYAASRGLVAVLPDTRFEHFEADFQKLLDHLEQRGAEVGVDKERIATYAGSGPAYRSFPIIQNPAQTRVKAAVFYYGGASVPAYRLDLPVLIVRAGLDRPDVNRDLTKLASEAVTQNAPLTLLNHPSGYHGFETTNDDDATRDVIEQTIAFVKRATTPEVQAAVRRGMQEASAAGRVLTGNFAGAAATYAELVKAKPDDARMRLAYGEALLGAREFATACAEFEKLKGKGLGHRDLGLPAARACMQKGDSDAAIAWLMSIPLRFLPLAVAEEPVFASIKERADFKAVFQPR